MNYKLKTVYIMDNLNVIGGIETHLYYLAKKYKNRDLTVAYLKGAQVQADRLKELVRVIKILPGDTIECETVFVTAGSTLIERVKAQQTCFVIHADFKEQIKNDILPPNAIEANMKYDKYLAVSSVARDGFSPEAEVVYMPIELDKFEEPILLLSATRLTKEKGLKRMQALATALDNAKVNYLWHIYTDIPREIKSPNVFFFPPRIDIVHKMPLYDGLVQISDTEGFSVTLNEALILRIPLVTTPLPVLKNDFRIDDRSTIILPFDMKDISEQVEKIRHIKEMKATMPKYTPPKEKWNKYITKAKSNYKNEIIEVEALMPFLDLQRNKTVTIGERWSVDAYRGRYLIERKLVKGV